MSKVTKNKKSNDFNAQHSETTNYTYCVYFGIESATNDQPEYTHCWVGYADDETSHKSKVYRVKDRVKAKHLMANMAEDWNCEVASVGKIVTTQSKMNKQIDDLFSSALKSRKAPKVMTWNEDNGSDSKADFDNQDTLRTNELAK